MSLALERKMSNMFVRSGGGGGGGGGGALEKYTAMMSLDGFLFLMRSVED